MRQQIRAHKLLGNLEDAFRIDFTLWFQTLEFFHKLLQSRKKVADRYSFPSSPAERFVEA
jgi:hypothetical protein